MPTLINEELIEGIRASHSTIFNEAMNNSMADYQQLVGLLVQEYQSTGASNKYPFITSASRWREWVGERVWNAYEANSFTVNNRTFEESRRIHRDYLEDDSYGLFSPQIAELAAGWPSLLRELAIEVIRGNPVCVTGKALMAADHSYMEGNTINNLADGAFTRARFRAALAAGKTWKWANGEPINPNWTHLLVPESSRVDAFEVVVDDKVVHVEAGVGVTTVGNPDRGRVEMVQVDEMAAGEWALVASSLRGPNSSKFGLRPVGVQIRRRPTPVTNDVRSIEETGHYRFAASGRAEAFPTLPHLIYGRPRQ